MPDAWRALASTDWLAARLGSPALRVVDASWHLPSAGRDAAAEYRHAHIPGAVRFDLDVLSDPTSPLPHMLPSPEAFAAGVGALGIGSAHDIVVYDATGVNLSAPRAWWMFRVMGHARVAVLDGGLGKWRGEGRPVEAGMPVTSPATFIARFDRGRVASLADMRALVDAGGEGIVDARSADRFAGTSAEPRPGVRAGHMPGSRNVPFRSLVHADGTMLEPSALRERFTAAGVDLAQPVVATCGSGVTACALVHALHLLGHDDTAVYDGSWAEWGSLSRPG